jgi:hypothetical protein
MAFTVATLIVLLTDIGRSSMVKSGDFPGFYVLAEILQRDQAEHLYDAALQRQIENEIWPGFQGSFYMSVYPPFLAGFLRPLAWLSPGAAQAVWTVVMFGAFLGSFALVSRSLNLSKLIFCCALALSFSPVTAGVLGGQNTAMSMLILASAVWLLERESRRNDLLAGAILALWLCKPQFGVIALLAFGLLARRPWVLVSGSGVAGLLFLVGVSVMGWGWPFEWISIATQFGEQNYISNRAEMVSLVGTCKGIAITSGFYPGATVFKAASIVGVLSSVALVLDVIRVSRAKSLSVRAFAALFAAALPLVSPQTLFYDLGIPVVALLALWTPRTDREVYTVLLVVAASVGAFFLRLSVPLPIFFPFAVAFYLLVRRWLVQ